MPEVNHDHFRLSFVVPIYGDGAATGAFCGEVERVMREWLGSRWNFSRLEVIFVNDGSPNDSQKYLEETAKQYPFVRVIELSRNFGQHVALACGYQNATGDYVVSLNVDMQDPPDQIPLLLEAIVGSRLDIVVGLRRERKDDVTTKATSVMFNSLMNSLTGMRLPLNMASLRVMSRRFIDAINQLEESSPFLPALEEWLGFDRGYVEIRHAPRMEGRSTYTFTKRLGMAWNAIVSFSDLPMRIAAGLGALMTLGGLVLTGVLVFLKLAGVPRQPGYTSTVAIMVLLGGIQLLFLGLIAVYVGRIWRETQRRPRYVVRSEIPAAGTLGGEI